MPELSRKKNKIKTKNENIAYIWGVISGTCLVGTLWVVIDAMSK